MTLTSYNFINSLIENDYMVWNLGIPKAEKAPKLQKGIGWSTAGLEDVKPFLNYKSNSWGMRTGLQPNRKYIIALDFDLWIKINNNYEECHNTRKLYKEFEILNDVKDGLFSSSTENNKGCLVDITNCPSLIELIELDGRAKIQKQNYCLEVLCGANLALPPTITTCKINNKKLYPRAFLSEQYFLELKEGSNIYNFIYKYIDDAKLTNKVSAKYITKYNKKANYINLIDNIEEDKLEMDAKYIEPFLKLLSKDRISNYSTWRNIGLALKNICSNEEGFKLFNLVSSFSKNYEPNGVINAWNSWDNYVNKYDGLNHNYILKCANNDNPDKFYITYIEYLENTKEAEYKTKLAEFEKETFKILTPPIYLSYNHIANNYDILTYKDICHKYNEKYGSEFISEYMKDKNKKYYDYLNFIPDINFKQPENYTIYNSFDGFEVLKNIDNIKPKNFDIIINHLELICKDNDNMLKLLLQYIAHIIFKTTERPGIVPVIQGEEGCGKGTIYNIIRALIGDKYTFSTGSPEHDIFDKFNSSIYEKILINIDEGEWKNFKEGMEKFKKLITDDKYNMEKKGKDPITLTNYMWFMVTSNNIKMFNVSTSNRRFFFINMNSNKIGDKEYFDNLYDSLKDKGILLGFYNYLKELFNPKYDFIKAMHEYKTDYQKALEKNSKDPLYEFIYEYINDDKYINDSNVYITLNTIVNKYKGYCSLNDIKYTDNGKNIKLKLELYNINSYGRYSVDGKRLSCFKINKIEFINYIINKNLYIPLNENNM